MAHLRIDSVNGILTLVTHDGKVIEADAVTIRLVKNQAVKIETQAVKGQSKTASYTKFFANALTRDHRISRS
jgi:hypothetical protein